MNNELISFFVGVFIGIVAGVCSCIACNEEWRQDLVKRGHAEYSQTTGEWQWKEVAK